MTLEELAALPSGHGWVRTANGKMRGLYGLFSWELRWPRSGAVVVVTIDFKEIYLPDGLSQVLQTVVIRDNRQVQVMRDLKCDLEQVVWLIALSQEEVEEWLVSRYGSKILERLNIYPEGSV